MSENNSSLTQAINDMRTMRESYDQLAQGVVTAPILAELESGKAAIVAAINAMGGTATSSMSMGELADAIRALILVQLGELEYNIPIENAEQALNLAQTNCTKFVDDYTTQMYTPLIVDEWQAVEEVRYKKLLNYNFNLFSSDERKNGIYAITQCHNLKSVVFDSLQSITNQANYANIQSAVCSGNISLEEISAPNLTEIKTIEGGDANYQNAEATVFNTLPALKTIYFPKLTNIECTVLELSVTARLLNLNSKILSNTQLLENINLPSLKTISCLATNWNAAQVLANHESLKHVSLPNIKSVVQTSVNANANVCSILGGCPNIEYIEMGHISTEGGSITENMRCNIDPTNTYEDADKLAALNTSIREHWFANLYDYTGGTAHTLTLPTAFVQHMEPETIQVATDKNWTIVTF